MAAFDPSAFGSVPVGPSINTTAGAATGAAIGTGTQVYNQLPNYAGDINNIGANINSETAGQLPADVTRQIQQQAAERGVATGSPGSPNANASMLQALGLTSLDLTNLGQKNLTSILPTLPGANISQNPNFYVTPQQQYEADLQRSIFNAMPNPASAARANLNAAGSGYNTGRGAFGLPSATTIGGTDALGFPNESTATLPGQTGTNGVTVPYAGGGQPGGVPTATGTPSAPASDWATGGNYDTLEQILGKYGPTVTGVPDDSSDYEQPDQQPVMAGGDDFYGGGE